MKLEGGHLIELDVTEADGKVRLSGKKQVVLATLILHAVMAAEPVDYDNVPAQEGKQYQAAYALYNEAMGGGVTFPEYWELLGLLDNNDIMDKVFDLLESPNDT